VGDIAAVRILLFVQLSALALAVFVVGAPHPALADNGIKGSLVKIYTVANPADLLSPWQGLGTETYVGSGVIIEGNRILTNAHLVAEQVSIEVKRQGMTRRLEASVEAVGHECDLALLKVDDEGFFKDVHPLTVGDLPELQQTVEVYGFPVGGESISVTSGIVSRLEIGTYSHSGRDLLLAQIDAALNPGNSGGPIVASGGKGPRRIVGIAMQTLDGAENVGYMIPAPVIRHFLIDIKDGRYDGFPSLGVSWQSVENRAQRQALGLADEETGALITKVNDGASASGQLAPGDMLLAIGGAPIAEDLTISLGGDVRIGAGWAVQRSQVGEEVKLAIARDGKRLERTVRLTNTPFLVDGRDYDTKPTYFIFGGLVFQPLTLDFLEFLYDWSYDLPYYAYHQEFRTPERHQIVLLSKVLAGRLNRGYHDWSNVVIATVEGTKVRDIEHVVSLIENAQGPFLEVGAEDGSRLVLDLATAREHGPDILERYGVAHDRSPDLRRGAALASVK
jgi:S1-C subfamily serine protease